MATDSAKRDGPALLFHSGGQFYCFCASDSRMVKKLEWIETAQLAVSSILFQSLSLSSYSPYNPPSTTRSMRSERVQNDWGATAGLRYRNGQPRTSFTERVSGGGEPHPESPDQGSAITLRRRKSHIGGARSPAGTKGAGGSGRSSATRYDSGLVSEAHRKKV